MERTGDGLLLAEVGEERGLGGGRVCGDESEDGVAQIVDAGAGEGGGFYGGVGGLIGDGGGGGEVVLVDDNEEGPVGDGGEDGFVLWVERGGCIEYKKDDVGFGDGLAGFGDAYDFGLVRGVTEASCVDEFYGDAFERDAFGNQIAGCAGGGGDNGSFALN